MGCHSLLVLLLYIIGVKSLIDESNCPIGWQFANDRCIRVVALADTRNNAQNTCENDGGHLLDVDGTTRLDDVIDILKQLHDGGLDEPTFHLGTTTKGLHRTINGEYKIIATSPLSAYPFICALDGDAKRRLLVQQNLMPKGAPRISTYGNSEIYYHARHDADFVALPCIVDGHPTPTVSWYRNDIEVVSPTLNNSTYLVSGGSLLVPATASLAYSSFHCAARNRHGVVRSPAMLLKPSFIDDFSQTRFDVYPLVNGGAKLECDAPAHQPKSMTYSWLHSSSTEKILAQNERRFISLDGTLFFSYLLPEDDDSYACSLSVYATQAGSYGPFFRLVANTTTHRSFAARLDSTQPQLFPAQPMPGEAVYLECFAYGSPLPKYKWQRVDGKPLPKRAHVTNHGRVLKIDKVRPSDAGKYRCVASNAHGASSGDVLLKLRARPTIVQGLYDRLVATSSNVQLECVLSNADSYSSIEWFKNAKPIVPLLLPPAQRKRLTIANHILTIKSANEHDTGIYQCVVSNEVGSSTSSALITVKDVAPRFPPGAVPRRVYATIGTRIRIPCVFEASPLGYGSWADAGGRQLNTTNGVLEFENVTKTEAGLYFCTARNRQGKAHTQVDLVVMDKKTNETESLSCQLEITCNDATACNDLMNDGRLACATAASPIALTAHPTENGFRLRWRLAPSAERQHRGARDHTSANVRDSAAYVVEMRTRRERRWHRADNRSLVEIAPTRASLINLPPNTELQFRVRAVDASGTPGTASAPSEWFKTPPSAPTEAIDGLKWRSVDRDTILVEWQPLANSAGDNLRYRVTWNDASNSSEVANQLDIDHPQAIIRLANSPEPCRTVELSVRAVNDQGSAEMSTDTVAFVSGRGRLPTVRMHNVRPLNATHVNVTWTWQEQSDCDFRNAVMISCKHRNKSTIVETTVIDTTTTLIGDLEADSAYNCTITAVDNHGNFGPPSEVFVIHTKEKQPTEAPKILKLMMKRLENDYTTILEWTAVELQKSASSNNSLHSKLEHKHHHGCGYRIFIYISETATIPVELDMSWHRLSDKQHPSARLDGLKLMYKYTVQVAAYNPGGIGPLSEPKSIRLGSHASLDLSSSSLSSSASTSSLLFRTIQLLSVHMLLLIL